MTAREIVILGLVLPLAGCSASEGAKDISGSMGRGEVKLIRLDDGTRCAVLVGYQKGALSCDWKKE